MPALAKNIQDLVDSRELHGQRTEGPWERASVDEQFWRALALPFPPPPIKGTSFLIPISSFDDLVNAHQEMRIPLDNFWMRSVLSPTWGTAYFFKWSGEVRALVLAVSRSNDLTRVAAQDCCRANSSLNPISLTANPCCNRIHCEQ
jgi:hypothetical protein